MIYAIQAVNGGPIKLGLSVHPDKRRSTLQGAHYEPLRLLAVLPGTVAQERELHKELADDRLRGEWFKDTPRVRKAIKCREHAITGGPREQLEFAAEHIGFAADAIGRDNADAAVDWLAFTTRSLRELLRR